MVRGTVKTASKFQGFVDFDNNEGVENNYGDVREQFHDNDLTPECINLVINWILAQCSFPDGSFVNIREDELFHFKKLKNVEYFIVHNISETRSFALNS